MKKRTVLLLLLLNIFLVACSGNYSSDPTVSNQELDFKSVFDPETGAIFSLGDPRSHFEEVFGSGESIISGRAMHYEGEFERFSFYRADGSRVALVEFLDDKAIDISSTSGLEFAHISFGTMMDDLPTAFQYAPWMTFDNNRHAFMFYDSYGNLVADSEQAAYSLHVRAHLAAGGNLITSIQLSWLEPLHLLLG